MFKVQKGTIGYIKKKKIRLGIFTFGGFLFSFLLYLTGYLIFHTNKNTITVFAILIILPVAKVMAQFIAIPWTNQVNEEDAQKIKMQLNKLPIFYELIITSLETRFPILYLVIDKDDHIIAFTKQNNVDPEKFQKGVTNFLRHYNWEAEVQLFFDENKFQKRAIQLSEKNQELNQEDILHINEVFEKISIMSI